MGYTYITLSDLAFNAINWPLVILNLIANIFFAFCLIFPPLNKDGLKQPLNLLLGSLISCAIAYLIFLTTNYCVLVFMSDENFFTFYYITYLLVNYTLNTSMTSSVWLNFFYYTQIVPTQRALFIWVKRNIKYIIYCALFVDRMFYLFDCTVSLSFYLIFIYFTSESTFDNNITSSNATNVNITATDNIVIGLYYAMQVFFYMEIVYSGVSLLVMMVSSFTTVSYLHRHIRSMSVSGSPFSSPRLQSQVRVTVTGILQGVFYLLCEVWILFNKLTSTYSQTFSIDLSVTYTIVSLYMTGTSVNLAVGQALFRQRAAGVWLKVSQIVKSKRLSCKLT